MFLWWITLELLFVFIFADKMFLQNIKTQNINFCLWKFWIAYPSACKVDWGRRFYSIFSFTSLVSKLIKYLTFLYIPSINTYARKKIIMVLVFFCHETSTLTITTILNVCECCKNNLDNDKLILVLQKFVTYKNNPK